VRHKAAFSLVCVDTSEDAVVDAQNMVGVRVRVRARIELRDVFAQRLFAESGVLSIITCRPL